MRRTIVGAAFVAMLLPSSAKAGDDIFGLGFELFEVCDVRAHAPISDKCYGLVGAVAEIVMINQAMPEAQRIGPATCIPHGTKVPDIIEAIRPKLRSVFMCGGLCTNTSWVISALAAVYPCKT
ncbi:MAG TPA: hypothetical protein VMQ73_23325 [Methylomirabilota bacterium]|nr:hypothetical protein [Methylomirabilota bacterium]